MEEVVLADSGDPDLILELDEALTQLAAADAVSRERQARVVAQEKGVDEATQLDAPCSCCRCPISPTGKE
jgi:hypothetical protein